MTNKLKINKYYYFKNMMETKQNNNNNEFIVLATLKAIGDISVKIKIKECNYIALHKYF